MLHALLTLAQKRCAGGRKELAVAIGAVDERPHKQDRRAAACSKPDKTRPFQTRPYLRHKMLCRASHRITL